MKSAENIKSKVMTFDFKLWGVKYGSMGLCTY